MFSESFVNIRIVYIWHFPENEDNRTAASEARSIYGLALPGEIAVVTSICIARPTLPGRLALHIWELTFRFARIAYTTNAETENFRIISQGACTT